MASGHEYRANRPNTWLLRPLLQSEDSSCQPGAVHTWPIATFRFTAEFDRYRGIADMAGLAGGLTPSRMTRIGTQERGQRVTYLAHRLLAGEGAMR
jgi:hypothetical protein